VPWYNKSEAATNLTHPETTLVTEGEQLNTLHINLPENNPGWFGLIWFTIILVPIAIGGGVLQPSINSLITQKVEPTEVGAALGTSVAFVSLSNVLAPLVLGGVFQLFGSTAPFLISGIFLLFLWQMAKKSI
jgi:dipeptide/tripeptide permease